MRVLSKVLLPSCPFCQVCLCQCAALIFAPIGSILFTKMFPPIVRRRHVLALGGACKCHECSFSFFCYHLYCLIKTREYHYCWLVLDIGIYALPPWVGLPLALVCISGVGVPRSLGPGNFGKCACKGMICCCRTLCCS